MRGSLRVVFLVGCLLAALNGVIRGEGSVLAAPARQEAAASGGPTVADVVAVAGDEVPRYGRYEAAFAIADSVATNPYYPYDPNPPAGVEAGGGITVDALLLPPGESDWGRARMSPCFYYQPVEELGAGAGVGLVPVGAAGWRLRFSPDQVGVWQWKLRATDARGSSESAVYQFVCAPSESKGYIRVSETDTRFFEYADGTPFTAPLVNLEEGSPFGSLASIRSSIAALGSNGVRFVRWFPTAEGANYYVVPFGDRLSPSWAFGNASTVYSGADAASNKRFSFAPYYYSAQNVPAIPGARYRLTFRAAVTGERVLRAQVANRSDWQLDVCSATARYHESVGCACNARNSDWQTYELTFTNTSYTTLNVALRGLYSSSDAPAPFDKVQNGSVQLSSIVLQRDETGQGGWGPNLLTRGDPDTYSYVDQVAAARLDEVLRLSEEYGVYHKLTLFHKNDQVLNALYPDGTVRSPGAPSVFYSGEGQPSRWYQQAYTRYFVARWSYSTALHSLELGNENDLSAASYSAGYALARLVHDLSPRHIMMSNSFWGWWVETFWTDPTWGELMDYSDKHWYANTAGASCSSAGCELISDVWDDSAAYQRESALRFGEYRRAFGYDKPIVRGEGGVAQSATQPQHPLVAQDGSGTYYHKKLWAHIGTLGSSCDGEWYPRFFVSGGAFPNADTTALAMYAAYERFLKGEPLSNGLYREVGTDLAGDQQVVLTDAAGALRAWGVADATNGRALLWIDNADQTWAKAVSGAAIPAASGTLTVGGLPTGTYQLDWWDTRAGAIRETTSQGVGADGLLVLRVDGLLSDVALRCVLTDGTEPPTATWTPLLTATPSATPTVAPTRTATPQFTPSPTATSAFIPVVRGRPTAKPTRTPRPKSK